MTSRNCIAILSLSLLAACSVSPVAAVDLFSEDFEGLTLQPVVTFESELRSRAAWTDVAPDGWTADNSQVATVGNPNSGVVEFEGWRFVDKEWWIQTAGGQEREQFLNASGIVAVADPDEWDDFGTPSPSSLGSFDARLTTPAISLAGVQPNEAKVFFHSSWRDEVMQTATLTARYNDPANTAIEILRWESQSSLPGDIPNPFFKDDAPNEGLTFDLLNPPGASNVQLEFRLFDAGNNWWWSFDNLQVFTGDGPSGDGALRTIIDRDTNNIRIVNNTGEPVDLRGYSLRSGSGAIDERNATFLSDVNPSSGWLRATKFDDSSWDLSEVHLSSDMLAADGEINFGDDVWVNFYRDSSDFTFEYLVAGSDDPITGIVEVIGNAGETYDFLDLNYNGEVEIGDWLTFSDGFGVDLTGLPEAQRYNLGDLDNDAAHTHNDFIEFLRIYDSVNGQGAFYSDLANLPEPGTLCLLLVGGLTLFGSNRRVRPNSLLLILLSSIGISAMIVDTSQAQLTLLFEDFESLPLGSSVEEGEPVQEVWTDVPPAGWNIDNSGMPGDINNPDENGVREWYGWSFADKNWWDFVAGGQGREEFNRGSGTVMIADSDEWDDQDGAARTAIAQASTPTNFYDTLISTAAVSIPNGIPAGRIQLSFDSSWRDEGFDDLDNTNNQTAFVNVRYDGGSPIEVLKWDSDPESDTFKNDSPNERVTLDLQYDGAASELQLEFGYGNAWNDWWWAVDNLLVSVPADPSVLVIDPDSGAGYLEGGDVISVSKKSIDIQSAIGALTPSTFTGLSGANPNQVDGPDPGVTAGDSPGEQWEVLTNTSNRFYEAFLFGDTEFNINRSEFMGIIFDTSTSVEDRDVTFTYSTSTGDVIEGMVIYESRVDGDFNNDGNYDCTDIDSLVAVIAAGSNDAAFDLNGDNVVNTADRDIWLSFAGTANLSSGNSYLQGDANLDGVVDVSDFNQWNSNKFNSVAAWCAGDFTADGVVDVSDFNIWNSNKFNSALGGAALPEPSSILLAGFPLLLLTAFRRRPSVRASWLIAAIGLLIFMPQLNRDAQAFTLDRDYRMGDDPLENAVIGGLVSDSGTGTRDSEGLPMMNQRIHLLGKSRLNTILRPKYVSVSDRPDGVSGLGIALNPMGVERAYLHSGFTEALNFPERSPSSVFAPGGTIDYTIISDRGFQLWAKPTLVRESDIVMDTNQHGVLINSENLFSMRYAEVDYVTDVTPMANTWYHLSVVRPFGPDNGSIFYINGVAEAAAFGQYNIERVVNEDTPSSNIADLDTSPLVVGASTGADHGLGRYFSGVVDDLEMFVMGLNGSNDFGEYVFENDNGYASVFSPAVDGDIDGDSIVSLLDAQLFADNWLREKQLSWTTENGQAFSLVVGDLESRGWGDFNYDGIADLADWAILNNANPSAGAAAMRWINGVPEPASCAGLLMGGAFLLSRRRRKTCSR